jgi:hypothetical protein
MLYFSRVAHLVIYSSIHQFVNLTFLNACEKKSFVNEKDRSKNITHAFCDTCGFHENLRNVPQNDLLTFSLRREGQ